MAQRFRAEPPLARRARTVDIAEAGAVSQDEWVLLGRLAEVGPPKAVRLDLSREHVLAIVGKRGSGKSYSLGSFLEGMATAEPVTPIGATSHTRGALLFDTLNIFQWMGSPVSGGSSTSLHVARQARDLAAWGLTPLPLNIDMWTPAGHEGRTTAAARGFRIRTGDMEAADWAALLRVDTVLDPMGQLLVLALDKVAVRGWTAQAGFVKPRADYALGDLLDCLAEDPDIERDYNRETVRAVRQRLAAYEATPMFGAVGTPLSDLVIPGRLSVMLLSGVPEHLRTVVVFLLIRKLLAARASASEATKHLELRIGDEESLNRARETLSTAPPKCWVVIDEAQNVLPSERRTAASEILLRFVREGRNFGLSFGFTTQQPSAIDARIMAQVDTIIAHTLTVERDLNYVLGNLKSRLPERVSFQGRPLKASDVIRQLGVGQAFVTSTETDRCFFMDVRPRSSIHGGFES